MRGAGHLAYAQTRLQARLGTALTPASRDQLHAARDLPGLLAAARASALRRYTTRLAPGLDPHQLERHLDDEWLALVDEIAGWQPREWRPALRWLRWLPSLPSLQLLARGGRLPPWARVEPWLRSALVTQDRAIVTEWLTRWRALWPPQPTARAALERIVRDVAAYDAALRVPALRDSREPRRALRQRLLRTFRRHPVSPAASVAYLALEGLELLELRGQVLRHAVLDPGPA